MKASIVSLGCPKNLADSEALVQGLRKRGIVLSAEPESADFLLVNTCGFIEDAKRESIDEILRLAGLKSNGTRLVVFGCLAQRYRDKLRREMPEVDAIFGVGEEKEIIEYCGRLSGEAPSSPAEAGDREACALFARELSPWVAPVKVAEGCDRRCSFCVIPSIRGPFRSRDPEDILREAEALVKSGVKELMLVAQDLTGYGRDLRGYGLPRLLRDMASIQGDFWVRPLYLYPIGIDDGLLSAMAGESKVCKYVDLPLQHSEDRVLKLMGRPGGRLKYEALISRIRGALPGATLRTAFIVGFPGERDRDFEGLLDFVRKARFERLGAFKYSREEDTPAALLRGQVSWRVKDERYEELMELQAGISLEINRSLLGRAARVLIETVEDGAAQGRMASQAHGIDGVTVVKGEGLRAGEFAEVVVTGASHYDLQAEAAR